MFKGHVFFQWEYLYMNCTGENFWNFWVLRIRNQKVVFFGRLYFFCLKTIVFLFVTVWYLHVFRLRLWGTCWHALWPRLLQRMLGRVSYAFACGLPQGEPSFLTLILFRVDFILSAMYLWFLRFLNLKIQEGEAHNIFCPAFDCYQLVPVEVIESVVSREMDKRYLHFDIKVTRQKSTKQISFNS